MNVINNSVVDVSVDDLCVDKKPDRVKVVLDGLFERDGELWVNKAPGPISGSPKYKGDSLIDLKSYHGDLNCHHCNGDSDSIDGAFFVCYFERRVLSDKRKVCYVCAECLDERNMATVNESDNNSGQVMGFKDLDF